MLEVVFLILASVFLIAGSPEIFFQFLIFLSKNLMYIYSVEEKILPKKFSNEYEDCKEKVTAWIPRQLNSKKNEDILNG